MTLNVVRVAASIWAIAATGWVLFAGVYTNSVGAGQRADQVNGPLLALWPVCLCILVVGQAVAIRDRLSLWELLLAGVVLLALVLSLASFGLFYLPSWLVLTSCSAFRLLRQRGADS